MSVPFHKYFCVSGTHKTYFIYYKARKIFPKSQNGHMWIFHSKSHYSQNYEIKYLILNQINIHNYVLIVTRLANYGVDNEYLI